MLRLNKYMPLNRMQLSHTIDVKDLGRYLGFVCRASCCDMFVDWDHWFGSFLKDSELEALTQEHGLEPRKKPAIAEPWPYKVSIQTSKNQVDFLRASGLTGYERYMSWEGKTMTILDEKLDASFNQPSPTNENSASSREFTIQSYW